MAHKLDEKKEWKLLLDHFKEMESVHLKDLFTEKNRAKTFSFQTNDLFIDYSKNLINQKTLNLLINTKFLEEAIMLLGDNLHLHK